jgi:hypothetical protein
VADDTIDVGPGTFTADTGVGEGFGSLTIQGSTSGSSTTLDGPSFSADRASLTLNRFVVDGDGGDPIDSEYASDITVFDSTITDSSTAVCGCGPEADVTITDSTLSGNTVAAESDNSGGVFITDSTLSGNTVAAEDTSGAVGVTASTISGNRVGFEGAAGASAAATIVSNNSGGDCTFSSGSLGDLGYNIDGDGTCALTATTSQSDVDPDLGSLTNNGGPTQTMKPKRGSPAINRIPVGTNDGVSLCPGINGTDQRGVPRPQGSKCDIGAVDVQTVAPTVTAVSPHTGPSSGGTPITITGTGFVARAIVVIAQGNGSGTGAIAATNVVVVSPTKITATTGGGAKAGSWNLFVITSGGTSAPNKGDTYTYG